MNSWLGKVCLLFAVVLFGCGNATTSQQSVSKTDDLKSLARDYVAADLTEEQQENVLEKLRILTPDEVIIFGKHVKEELGETTITPPIVERNMEGQPNQDGLCSDKDKIISDNLQLLYGSHATVFNVTPDQLDAVANDIASKETFTSGDMCSDQVVDSTTGIIVRKGDSCYFDDNWPEKLTYTSSSKDTKKAGGSGRVRNKKAEKICDFVLYLPSKKYKKVTSRSAMARVVLASFGDKLAASPSRDAVILGYTRVFLFGWPTESWVRNNFAFK